MGSRIEDYAVVGDCRTMALVAKDGSIDWLCVPRFDSDACFAALLGEPGHGRWQIAPRAGLRKVTRRYRGETLVLETEFTTDSGAVRLIDFMPLLGETTAVVRIVEGLRGEVPMALELIVRFGYGAIVPWVRPSKLGGVSATAGPDSLRLSTPEGIRLVQVQDVDGDGIGDTSRAEFAVRAGQRMAFTLRWHPSHEAEPGEIDAERGLEQTEAWWLAWSARSTYDGGWRDEVARAALLLKALTYAPTGGLLAAATTSLPEQLGGVRNWDYRYCWLRDSTFTLFALMMAGYRDEARAWREWLLRAVAGKASQLQISYGLAGERRLTEWEVPWLPGYEGARPVRIGNAAANQLQLDVYGEVLDSLYQARRFGLEPETAAWQLQRGLLDFLESNWQQPDEGIWEVRGPRRHFTHSKVMAWVGLDRAVRSVEERGLPGPVDRWRAVRQAIHEDACTHGFHAGRKAFVQYYGSSGLDASLLMIPLVGFLPADDPRVRGTVDAIGRELMHDGFVLRYTNAEHVDGLPQGEGAFLACTFWYCDNLVLQGQVDEARALFERLLGLRNDVGLLAEEYDPRAGRQVGNVPQAFSLVSLINSAQNLSQGGGPCHQRPAGGGGAG